GLYRVKLESPSSVSKAASISDIFDKGLPSGMAFGPDGALYVVANKQVGKNQTQAMISKGVADGSGGFTWQLFASTDPYPMSNTPFDHVMNGIVVSPDGKWVFLNSGSRTDHGEVEDNDGAFPDAREVPLTAKIFRIPTDPMGQVLPNDEAALTSKGL